MGADLPEPLVHEDCDLRDFPFTPLYRARLFGSSFHARANDAEWRAGVTLWLKSWDQVPAGTLPDDDIDLCRLAELGRDLKTWKKIKQGAMRGWVKCSDGRMHHTVVAEGVLEAWEKRKSAKSKGKAGASKRWAGHKAGASEPDSTSIEENSTSISPDSPSTDPAIALAMPGDSKGQGEGQGESITSLRSVIAAPSVARPKREVAARISPDWKPRQEEIDFALELGVDVHKAADEFRDYWLSRARDATKANWDLTFRNRLRELAEQGKYRVLPFGKPAKQVSGSW